MHTILTITGLTLREARSRKILLAALIFGLLFLALFTTGLFFIDRLENTRLPQRRLMVATILMAGLYAVNFLTIMTAVLVPADTLSGEISSGIIQTVVSKPLRRWEVLLGKWIAFLLILSGYLGLMAGGVLLAGRVIANYVPPNITVGLALMHLEGTLLLTLSIAGGTCLSTITNGVMVFGMYGLAFIGGWMEHIGTMVDNAAARYLGIAASLLIPCESLWRLAAYYMQPKLVRDLQMTPFSSASVPNGTMVFWAAIYIGLSLIFALWQFRKRSL
jgi:ABC-type transport system involved in multi-copper enzyme maturation permease subunit